MDLDERAVRSERAARWGPWTLGVAGVALVGMGLYSFYLGRILPGLSDEFAGAAVALAAFGGGVVGLAVYAARHPSRHVRALRIDEAGLELRMSRPPDWSMRWGDRGRLLLTRGVSRAWAAGESRTLWSFRSGPFSARMDDRVARAVRDGARSSGYVIVEERRRYRFPPLTIETVRIDPPAESGPGSTRPA